MSLRTLIRLVALSLSLALASPFAPGAASIAALSAGVVLLGLTFAYLALPAGGGDLTRWQVRYQLDEGAEQERLEQVLSFLAAKAGHLVLEGNANGLFLEAPGAFDEYLQAQLPRALPDVRLTRSEADGEHSLAGSSLFSVGQPGREMLRWATESEGREIRVHLHHGPFVTAVARATHGRPSGRWLRIPVPRLLGRAWHRLPIWDELSAGTRLGSLFPATEHGAVYSSRSRLLDWTPPAEYTAEDSARYLGRSTDGRRLTLSYGLPLLTYGAPQTFLAGQVLQDLTAGYKVIVVSPYRGLLERIALEAEGTPVHWLDPQNPWRSAHLAVVAAEEWAEHDDDDVVVDAVQGFFAGAGVDTHLPGIGDFTRRLVRVLVSAARQRGRDLAFTDLYSIAGGTQTLRAALTGLQEVSPDAAELLSRLDGDAGYVQAVTVLSAIRTALRPLGNASFQTFCRAPFLNLSRMLNEKSLLLVPMTDADFPEHDRLLNAMLNLGLTRVLATHDDRRIALHLHEPDLYQDDTQRWIEAARRGPRITLLLDSQQFRAGLCIEQDIEAGQVLFRCPEELARDLIAAWHLPASPAELAELPVGTAIARLPGMVVALKVRDR